MSNFLLPDLGEGLQDAEIVAWHVSVGDHVVVDQPLVSVETQKAVVDIPSPQAGQIAALHGAPGDIVPVGSVLVEFDLQGETAADSVVGDLPHTAVDPEPHPTVKASPAVRQLSKRFGVDLDTVGGTGPDGTITMEDVRAASANSLGEPLRGPRRAMADTLTASARQVVPATVTADADVTGWYGSVSPTVRTVRAIVAGCLAEPALNASYDAVRQRRVLHQQKMDIGLAVDTPLGLIVPVIRDAGSLGSPELQDTIHSLKERVLDRTIAAKELSGATITFSNFGSLIGRYANLAIVTPQVAILGAGQITEQVVVVQHEPAVRKIMPLSLTFDHRVVTGGEAATFMRAVIDSLEKEIDDDMVRQSR